MATLGLKYTSATFPGVLVQQGTLNSRAVAYAEFAAPDAGYVTRLGVFARKNNNSPKITLALYALLPSGEPGALLGATAKITVPTIAGNVEGPLVNASGAAVAVRLAAGERFAVAIVVDGGTAEYANGRFGTVYARQTGSGVPTDPYGATQTLNDYGPAAYAEFTENGAPSVALVGPSAGASVNTTLPVFTGTFTDPDSAAPISDRLSQYSLEVRMSGQTSLVWGGSAATFVASASEANAALFTRTYGGSALAGGQSYEWRARVADQTGTWSAWSAWRSFSINALGQVDAYDATSPAAKVDTDPSLIAWGARWHHPQGLSATLAQVQILQDGAVVRQGAQVAPSPNPVPDSAAPGTAFTIPAVGSGIGAIQPGSYSYQIRARASDGQWSAWSDEKPFRINSPANVPSNLQPPSGATSTARPLLEWNLSDPDDDDLPGADVQSEIEITRPNGTVTTFTSLQYDATRGVGFFQTSTTEFPAGLYGTYKWRVRAQDLSAGALGYSAWSTRQTVDWVAGPSVTITAPSDGQAVATSVPTVAWTVAGGVQARFKVEIYEDDAPNPIRASDQISSPIGAYQIPVGWLKNGNAYDLVVTVWDGSNTKGVSLRRRFSVVYTNPEALPAVTASLVVERRDFEPNTVLLSWGITNYPPGEFGGYVIRRRLAGESEDLATTIRTITAAGQTQWRDYAAPPNVSLIYTLSQLRRVGAETLESDAVETTIEVPMTVPVLASVYDGGGLRTPLMWLKDNLGGGFERPESAYVTWGSDGKETLVATPATYGAETISLGITLRSDARGSLLDHFGDIVTLVKSGHPVCLRLEHQRLFCRIARYAWKRGGTPGTIGVSLDLREIAFDEGETPSV